jgi:hypothetical protein
MSFRFNPFTGNLDIVGTSGGGGGGVTGPPSSTNDAISTWLGTSGTILQDNPFTTIQPGGAVQAQGFVFNRQIVHDVTVPNNYNVIYRNITLLAGDIILDGDAEIILI